MPEYTWMAFCFTFPRFPICFAIPFPLEHVVTSNVYRRLEVVVWKNTRLFSWRDKIQFFFCSSSFAFCFRLNIFTSKIWICCYFLWPQEWVGGRKSWYTLLVFCFLLSQNLWRNHVKVIPYCKNYWYSLSELIIIIIC